MICGYAHRAICGKPLGSEESARFLKAISPNPDLAMSVFRHGLHLKDPRTDKSLTAEQIKTLFRPVEQMLFNVGTLAGVSLPRSKKKDFELLATRKNAEFCLFQQAYVRIRRPGTQLSERGSDPREYVTEYEESAERNEQR